MSVRVSLLAVALRVGQGSVEEPSVPMWGGAPAFQVRVHMTNPSDAPEHPEWDFNYSYVSNAASNATFSRYEFEAGQHDEVCKGITGSPGLGSPCTVVHASDSWLYIAYPDADFCCKCTQVIGAVRSDWLRDGGATYVGRVTKDVDGNPFLVDEADGWLKYGASDNYYYATPDAAQQPVRYMEHKNGVLKEWTFFLDTWVEQPSWLEDVPDLLAPPPNCQTRCVSDVCSWQPDSVLV
mmetsp:Transcript_1462/g.3968  ORF Transcript_1462/g.3968 Transcript_1462/m.3968 type:complete len:237 (-) Transcript_1462:58-768(-)